MASFAVRAASVAVAAALALPLAGGGGCGSRTACFAYTQAEYVANANTCPSITDALPEFTDPRCPGPVVSVDGPGSFDGELCCYAVTYADITPDCGNTPGTGGGPSSGTDTEFSTGTDFGGTGTETASEGCTCAQTIDEGLASCGVVEPPGDGLFSGLQGCISENCASSCPNFMGGSPLTADSGCPACAMTSCESELTACEAN